MKRRMLLIGMAVAPLTIALARSEHGQSFAEDQVMYKVTQRIDIAVTDLGDSTTAGPVVGLVGA